jgi:hypothetical protein
VLRCDQLQLLDGDDRHVESCPVVLVVGDLDHLVVAVVADDRADRAGGPSAGVFGLGDGLGEGDDIVFADCLLDCDGHDVSSLRRGKDGYKSGSRVRVADLPGRGHVDEAFALLAAATDGDQDDALDSPGCVAANFDHRGQLDAGVDGAFEIVDVFKCDAEDALEATDLGSRDLVGRIQEDVADGPRLLELAPEGVGESIRKAVDTVHGVTGETMMEILAVGRDLLRSEGIDPAWVPYTDAERRRRGLPWRRKLRRPRSTRAVRAPSRRRGGRPDALIH